MKIAVFVAACIALVVAHEVKRGMHFAFVLPHGAELIVGPIKTGFSCASRIYGYYADVDNGCKIFHVCVPRVDEAGAVMMDTDHYSFACGNLTSFDQENLVCVHDQDATNCGGAPGLYDKVNSKFGMMEKTGRVAHGYPYNMLRSL